MKILKIVPLGQSNLFMSPVIVILNSLRLNIVFHCPVQEFIFRFVGPAHADLKAPLFQLETTNLR